MPHRVFVHCIELSTFSCLITKMLLPLMLWDIILFFLIPSSLCVYNTEAEPVLLVTNASQRHIPNRVVGTWEVKFYQEVKFLWKQRKRGDHKKEYFGQLKSCPRMLLIFPEGSSGRSVCFCAGRAVPGSELCCISSFWGECSTLCSANNVQTCRIRFSPILRGKTRIDYPTVLVLHPPTKAFCSHLLQKLVLQTPRLFSAHKGVCWWLAWFKNTRL